MKYQQMGVPVWWIRKLVDVSVARDKFVKLSEPRIYQSRPLWPLDCFRDDGIVRGEAVVFWEQADMRKFVKDVDLWVKSKLENSFRGGRKRRFECEDGEITAPIGHMHFNKDIETENVQNEKLRQLLEPPPVKVWAEVAATYASIPLEGSQHQPRFVPPIDLITGVSAERKAKEFVAVWRLVRLKWLYEVFVTRQPPGFATRKAWKSFTTGVFSNARLQPNNEISIARIRFAEFLCFRKVASLPRENFIFFKGEVPGTIDEKVTVQMVRDTVCELADLNFFFDMFEVEYHRTYDSPMEIHERMGPARSPLSLTFPQPIPRSKLAERGAWLGHVRNFIRPWKGPKPVDFELKLSDEPTIDEVTSLERAVAHVYCSNVTYILRRRPSLPRYE